MALFSYLHALKMYKEYIVGGDLYFNQVGSCCNKSERVLDYIDKNFPKKLLKTISLKFSHSTVNNWLNN